MSQGGQNITKEDALQFIKELDYIFKDKKEKVKEFFDVMKEYRHQRIDVSVVVVKVEDIFKDHKDLMLGFNKFLPKGYEILLLPKGEIQFEDAMRYVNKVKDRFQNKVDVYKSFLKILTSYREGTPIYKVYNEVATLFEGHRDLVRDFSKFCPSTAAGSST